MSSVAQRVGPEQGQDAATEQEQEQEGEIAEPIGELENDGKGHGGGCDCVACKVAVAMDRPPLHGSVGSLSPAGANVASDDPNDVQERYERQMSTQAPANPHDGEYVGAWHEAEGQTMEVVPQITLQRNERPMQRLIFPSATTFGLCLYQPQFTDVRWRANGTRIRIIATLTIHQPWDVHGGDHTDIENANSSAITANNYREVVADLRPTNTEPFSSPRTEYWSEALTRQHEAFHATDNWGWTRSRGLDQLKEWIRNPPAEQTFHAPDTTFSPSTSDFDRKVRRLLFAATDRLRGLNWLYHTGNTTDTTVSPPHNCPGEARAYADGRDEYEQLCDEIEGRFRNGEGA